LLGTSDVLALLFILTAMAIVLIPARAREN
jgi:hypothetical protein